MIDLKGSFKIKNLTIGNSIALSLIALLMISSTIVALIVIDRNTSDAPVINLSGRQRMLSQKLTKEVLLLVHSQTTELADKYRELLKSTLNSWTRVHSGLQKGDTKLNLPGNNSAEVQYLFAKMKPYYKTIYSSTEKIITLSSTELKQLTIHKKTIQENPSSRTKNH